MTKCARRQPLASDSTTHKRLLRIADVALRPPQILHVPLRILVVAFLQVDRRLLVILRVVVVVTGVGVLAPPADAGAVAPEQERNGAARDADEGQQGRGPLVAKAVVHLRGEEHDGGAPEAADKGLGGEGRGGLVLVGVDEVVVGRVVEEDEAESD